MWRIQTVQMATDHYPAEAWLRMCTDGSATSAIQDGGTGFVIKHPVLLKHLVLLQEIAAAITE